MSATINLLGFRGAKRPSTVQGRKSNSWQEAQLTNTQFKWRLALLRATGAQGKELFYHHPKHNNSSWEAKLKVTALKS